MQSSITSFFVKSTEKSTSQIENKEVEDIDSDLESSCSHERECQPQEASSAQPASSNSSLSDGDTDSPCKSRLSSDCTTVLTSSSDHCSSECCDADLSQPYHPKINYLNSKRKQGKQNRVFQSAWYDEYRWLTFCVTRNKAFCYYCRAAVSKGLINFSKKGKGTFVHTGFDNWKKAKERSKEHERCQVHMEACMKLEFLQQPSIATRLSSQLQENQEQRRKMLLKELSSIRYLARQGLAFRGHKESDGNLYQLLKLRACEIDGLELWLSEGQYLSHDIVNELLEMMAHQLLRGLLQEIIEAKWFALIADETRDISGTQFRYVG